MMSTKPGETACQKILARLDSFLDHELVAENNQELIDHLQKCPPCAAEAEGRRNVRWRLQSAIREVPVPEGLESRVRRRLRQAIQPPVRFLNVMAVAAAMTVCFGSWVAYHVPGQRNKAPGQDSYLVVAAGPRTPQVPQVFGSAALPHQIDFMRME